MSALLDCEDEVQERRVIQALLDTAIKQVASSGFAYFTLAVSWAQDRLTQ